MPHFVFNHNPLWIFLLVLLVIWTVIWKGLAMWKAAERGEKAWFIVFLVLNTVGILEILYLYVFSKDKSNVPMVVENK